MRPTPFDPQTDLAPIPFSDAVCRTARALKEKGLAWRPYVGCFVWDEKEIIPVSSPFPHRTYFILTLGHFLKHFTTIENMQQDLIWLPTWHQACQLCRMRGIGSSEIAQRIRVKMEAEPGVDLVALYELLLENL